MAVLVRKKSRESGEGESRAREHVGLGMMLRGRERRLQTGVRSNGEERKKGPVYERQGNG